MACVRICENTTHGGMNRLKLPTAHFVSLQLQRTHCYPIVQRRLMAVIVPPAWKKDRTPVTSLWGPRASGWIGSVTASAGRGARPASSSPGTGRSSQTTYQIECIITERLLEAVWALLHEPAVKESVRMDMISCGADGQGCATPASSRPGTGRSSHTTYLPLSVHHSLKAQHAAAARGCVGTAAGA